MGKKHILIIEDEEDYADLLRLRLQTMGFTVAHAGDGNEGLAQARKQRPDLILLDIMLPGADGGEIAQQLKSNPSFSSIPEIFLTAAITEEESARRWDSRAEMILSKTMDGGMIIQRIRQVLAETSKDAGGTGAARRNG